MPLLASRESPLNGFGPLDKKWASRTLAPDAGTPFVGGGEPRRDFGSCSSVEIFPDIVEVPDWETTTGGALRPASTSRSLSAALWRAASLTVIL
jgi:hypothetical protein